MAKEGWEKGVGPFSGNKLHVPMEKDESQRKYDVPVDIYDSITPSWERTEGFAAKLDKGKRKPS